MVVSRHISVALITPEMCYTIDAFYTLLRTHGLILWL